MASTSDSSNPENPQNTSNPLYLYPNKNPSLVLVSPILTGTNYHSWARAMRMALISKNKVMFIDRSASIPVATDPTYPAWERCNMMVLSWINRAISPSLAQSVLWLDRAIDVWEDLKARFSQNDVFRLADLQEDIQNLRQGDLSVSDYFTKLKLLWDEYLTLRPLLSYSCTTKCTCGIVETYRQRVDQDYVIRFLKGLSDRFASVKSNIMLLDPLPNINKTYSLVQQQERELGLCDTDATAMLVKTNISKPHNLSQPKQNNGGYSQSAVKQCTFCGKYRHTEATCYKKHGFPLGFNFRTQPNLTVNAVVTESIFVSKTPSDIPKVANPTYSLTPE